MFYSQWRPLRLKYSPHAKLMSLAMRSPLCMTGSCAGFIPAVLRWRIGSEPQQQPLLFPWRGVKKMVYLEKGWFTSKKDSFPETGRVHCSLQWPRYQLPLGPGKGCILGIPAVPGSWRNWNAGNSKAHLHHHPLCPVKFVPQLRSLHWGC